MEIKPIERYFFFGLLLTTFVFVLFIFKPFWIVLALSISFSVALQPLYKWIHSKINSAWVSSLIVVILFVFMLCLPLFFIGTIIFNQAQNLYFSTVAGQGFSPFLNSIENSINQALPEGIYFDVNQKISDFVLFISNNIAKIFSTTLSAIFSLILMLLAIFYFLKDGQQWKEELIKISPLHDEDDQKILDRLHLSINGVIRGYLLIALVQGVLMGIGLAIFGVPNPALWAVLAGIGSLIPMVGTGIVAIPAIIYLLLSTSLGIAIGFAIWSAILVGTIDNLLNPYLIGDKINIHPLIILFAVLGGISLLGPIGVLVGPLMVSLLYTLVSIYKTEFE